MVLSLILTVRELQEQRGHGEAESGYHERPEYAIAEYAKLKPELQGKHQDQSVY